MWDLEEGRPEALCIDTMNMGGRVSGLAFAGVNRLVAAVCYA